MIGQRQPVPGCPHWFVTALNRGFDPDDGGIYTEVQITVDDGDDVGQRQTLVLRLPGRPEETVVLEAAQAQVVAWVRQLPLEDQGDWLARWAILRVMCEACKKPGTECTCESGPISYPADLMRAVSELRRDLHFDVREGA